MLSNYEYYLCFLWRLFKFDFGLKLHDITVSLPQHIIQAINTFKTRNYYRFFSSPPNIFIMIYETIFPLKFIN